MVQHVVIVLGIYSIGIDSAGCHGRQDMACEEHWIKYIIASYPPLKR
jgi:hypothetical protein